MALAWAAFTAFMGHMEFVCSGWTHMKEGCVCTRVCISPQKGLRFFSL